MKSSLVTRASVVLLTATLIAGPQTVAYGNEAAIEVMGDAYASPGQRVELVDGRALNVRCSGDGLPVVVLEAGGNADSSTWYRVLPRLAKLTRVCAYDRAGYGFSDEGPYPRDLAADVADLHALIQAAAIPVPVVLVGHSLGSNIVRSMAQRYPGTVAGMVLVDPPEQGADEKFPLDWQSQIASMSAQRAEILSGCEVAAEAGETEIIRKKCLRAPPPWMSAPVVAAMTDNKSKPSYWRTLRSELTHNIALFSSPVPADESYGEIPLVLLSVPGQDNDVPDEVRAVIDASRRETHARILAASANSSHVQVPDASHDIQLDNPDAVVSAVKQLLGREVAAPAPQSDK